MFGESSLVAPNSERLVVERLPAPRRELALLLRQPAGLHVVYTGAITTPGINPGVSAVRSPPLRPARPPGFRMPKNKLPTRKITLTIVGIGKTKDGLHRRSLPLTLALAFALYLNPCWLRRKQGQEARGL